MFKELDALKQEWKRTDTPAVNQNRMAVRWVLDKYHKEFYKWLGDNDLDEKYVQEVVYYLKKSKVSLYLWQETLYNQNKETLILRSFNWMYSTRGFFFWKSVDARWIHYNS